MTMQVSLDQLSVFAKWFWEQVDGARVFAFHAPMAGGKTTTINALCREKGVKDAISSPTFAIINEYRYPGDHKEESIFHIDLYRLESADEVLQSGVEDCVHSGNICFVEWPQKAPYLFDEKTVHVVIEPVDESTRQVKILSAAEFAHSSVAEQL